MSYELKPLTAFFYLINQSIERLFDLNTANIWLVGVNLIWFVVVLVFAVILPGQLVVKKMFPSIGLFGLVLAFMMGNLWLFLWRYFCISAGLGNTFFVISVIFLAVISLKFGAWGILNSQLKLWRSKHTKLIIFFLFMSLAWTLGTFNTGLVDQNGQTIFSMWLGGERLMMTGHATTVYEQIPPIHPYWQDVYLQYHYFGTVLQTAYHSFGGNALIINFLLLPTVISIVVSAAFYYLGFAITKSRWFALASVIIYYWWDTLGYFFPPEYRYGETRWWVTIFTDHKHAYINGNSHMFAALFTLMGLVFFWLYLSRKKFNNLSLVIAGMSGGVLLLMKAQAFLAFVGAVLIYVVLLFVSGLFAKESFLKESLKTAWWLVVGGALTAIPLFVSNRVQLTHPDEKNILFSPLSHPLGALNNVPAIHSRIDSLAPGITSQLNFWREYQLPPDLVKYFWLISLGFMLVAISAKVLGFLAPLMTLKLEEKRQRMILMLFSLALSATLATMLLWLALGNQWQFLFTAFIPLSLLTVFVINKLPFSKILFVLLTLLSLPTGLGVLADSPIDRTLPTAEIVSVSKIKKMRQPMSTCFFGLPINSEDPNSPVDLYNQVREIMYPFYAGCRVNAAMGPKPILNFALQDTDHIYKVLKPDLLAVGDLETLGGYLNQYSPEFVWLPINNRYSVNAAELVQYGYEIKEQDEVASILVKSSAQ